MAFERKVVKAINRMELGQLNYHQWVQYHDENLGAGFCEPEAFFIFPKKIVLFEAKLTGGPLGKLQMEWLYKPLLEFIFKRPVVCLLVCKYKTADTPGPFVASPEEFLAKEFSFATWHWIGD